MVRRRWRTKPVAIKAARSSVRGLEAIHRHRRGGRLPATRPLQIHPSPYSWLEVVGAPPRHRADGIADMGRRWPDLSTLWVTVCPSGIATMPRHTFVGEGGRLIQCPSNPQVQSKQMVETRSPEAQQGGGVWEFCVCVYIWICCMHTYMYKYIYIYT